MVSGSSKLVYALTCLSPERTGPLLPSCPVPPSNSGGNKWTIHVKRERVSWGAGGGAEGGMPPTNSIESHWLFIYIHTF